MLVLLAAPAPRPTYARVRTLKEVQAYIERIRYYLEGILLRRTGKVTRLTWGQVERLALLRAGYLPAQPADAEMLTAFEEASRRERKAQHRKRHPN